MMFGDGIIESRGGSFQEGTKGNIDYLGRYLVLVVVVVIGYY